MLNRALLIVDYQYGFVNEHTQHLREGIERFQRDFDRVIATTFYRRSDSLMCRLLDIEGFERGSSDTALAFTLRPGGTLIEKSTYSVVTPAFVNVLKAAGVREIYVCGVDTDQCVLMDASALLENDIKPVVCEDLTASAAGPDYHERGLFLLRRLVGREQVRTVLRRTAVR